MPAKSNSDAIRDVEREVAKLIERSDRDRRDFARIDVTLAKITDVLDDLKARVAVLEALQADDRSAKEEHARRRGMVWIAVLGSLLTLAVNITLTAWKR